jgi:putative DNA primase/helicase
MMAPDPKQTPPKQTPEGASHPAPRAPEAAAASSDGDGPEQAIRDAAAAAEVVEISDYSPPAESGGGGELLHRCSRLPQNDTGNAGRLKLRYGHRLIWVEGWGWLAWVGSHWSSTDGERLAKTWAQRTAALIRKEVGVIEAEGPHPVEDDKAFEKRVAARRAWANTSGMWPRTKAMLEAAAPHLAVPVERLDARPELFNVANGTLELTVSDTGDALPEGAWQCREHRPGDYLTRVSPVVYDPDAPAERWRRFVAETHADEEQRLYVQRAAGYTMTGHVREEKIFLHHGGGSNGKSVFLEVLAEVFGSYAISLPFETFLVDERRSGGQATPDLARLPGVRFCRTGEPEGNAQFSEAMVKRITGADTLQARPLYGAQFEFRPQFRLWAAFNARPRVRGQDHGIWRRIDLVGWEATFIDPWERDKFPSAPRKDTRLMEALRGELPGVLNWLLEGYREWGRVGLATPECVRALTDDYRAESNPMGQFLSGCCRVGGDRWTQAARLYRAYAAWCREAAIDPLSQTGFGRSLRQMGVERSKIGTVSWRVEIVDDDLIRDLDGPPEEPEF